mgnify:CR=1 FL=1|jgi:hypothetical protein
MEQLSSQDLMDLHSILSKMVSLHSIEESEMIDILTKAGLARLPEGQGWMDSTGSIYTLLR